MKKILYPLVLATLLSGCYTSRFPISQNGLFIEPTRSETKIFLLWGLVPQPKYTDPAQICGSIDNVGMVETKTGLWDGVISLLTLGLISTRTANVYCAGDGYQTQYMMQYHPVVPPTALGGYQQPQWQSSPYNNPYVGQNYSRR